MAYILVHDFLPKSINFLHFAFLVVEWSSHNKNGVFCWYFHWKIRLLQSLKHQEGNFNVRILIKSGYYIVPNPSNFTCNAGLSWSISVSVNSDWITSISSSSNCKRILATLSWWLKFRGLIFVVWSENRLEI